MSSQLQLQKFIDDNYHGDAYELQKALQELIRVPKQQPKRSAASTPLIIELDNVSRTYKVGRRNTIAAVQNAALQIREGEIVALTGPSGSGKSTLMHLIGGLDKPDSGSLTVDGQRVDKMSAGQLSTYRNKTVGFVFQFFYLQPFLRADRNVEVPLMFARTKRKSRLQVVAKAIESVELTDRAAALPKELSGGQMQRVAIARALVNRPKIILADEPTGNLDSKTSQHILKQLSAIRDEFGTTMVIVTHDPRVAAWADREIVLEDGKILP